MKIWKYPITLIISFITITATIQKSFAIRIIPSQPYATQYWKQSSDYPVPGFCHYNWYENGWNFEGCLLDSRDWKVTATTSFVYNGLNSIPSPPSELDDYLVNNWRLVQIGNFSSNRIQIQSMELNLNINSDDVSVSTKSVPESNHVFGVIAIFTWNAILWFKRKKD